MAQGVMVEVQPKMPSNLVGRKVSDLSIEEIAELQVSKRYKPSFCWRVIRSRGRAAIQAYASIFSYAKGWVIRHENMMDDCQFTDYTLK